LTGKKWSSCEITKRKGHKKKWRRYVSQRHCWYENDVLILICF